MRQEAEKGKETCEEKEETVRRVGRKWERRNLEKEIADEESDTEYQITKARRDKKREMSMMK